MVVSWNDACTEFKLTIDQRLAGRTFNRSEFAKGVETQLNDGSAVVIWADAGDALRPALSLRAALAGLPLHGSNSPTSDRLNLAFGAALIVAGTTALFASSVVKGDDGSLIRMGAFVSAGLFAALSPFIQRGALWASALAFNLFALDTAFVVATQTGDVTVVLNPIWWAVRLALVYALFKGMEAARERRGDALIEARPIHV